MKTSKFLFFLLLAVLGFSSFGSQAKAQSVSVNFSTFYNDLNPYGRWIDNPRYGQVWAYDEPGFRPYYTKGHWEYTDYGWAWASDYQWGWAPFHYGRWEQDPYYGWIWIPGYEWASAWVEWSEADDYYGWAPLGYGLDINVSFGSIPRDWWVYIPRQHIYNSNLYDYCVFPGRNNNFYNHSRIINNIYNGRGARYMTGPDRSEVERYTNNRIETRRIEYGRPQNAGNNWGRNRNEVAGQSDRYNGQSRIDNNRRAGNIYQQRRNQIQPQNNDAQQRQDQYRQNRVTNGAEQNSNNFPRTRQGRENNAGNAGQGQNNFPRQRQNLPQQNVPRQDLPSQDMRGHRGFDQRSNNQRMPSTQPQMENRQNQQRNFGGGQSGGRQNGGGQNGGRQNDRQSNGGSGDQGRSDHRGGRRG